MNVCDVKQVTYINEQTVNYHLSLKQTKLVTAGEHSGAFSSCDWPSWTLE